MTASCPLPPGAREGTELIERGFTRDVEVAAALDQETCAPVLKAGAYVPYMA